MINSINMKTLLDLIEADDLAKMADYLVAEIQKLAGAGAQCRPAGRQHAAYRV